MKKTGIICEYNPFHNGHQKQLRNLDCSVCLMSGNFVQRGEPAVLDKYTRAKAAVLCGASLVLELPVTYVLRSAEGFASGGVEIFNRLGGMDALCFGCESGQPETILKTAELLLKPEFSFVLKEQLHLGISFPAARQKALEIMGADASALEKPNDILAVEYCKALLKSRSCMKPEMILREGDYHGSTDPENPSAGSLRKMENWEGYVPEPAREVFRTAPRYDIITGERAWLARLRSMSEAEFEALPFGSEGLWRKVMGACREKNSLEEIIEASKSKRYTRTRIMRMLLCAYLGITEEMLSRQVPYVRVLAFDGKGQEILHELRRGAEIPVIHAGEDGPDPEYRELERRASDLYGLFRTDEIGSAGREKAARIFRKNL